MTNPADEMELRECPFCGAQGVRETDVGATGYQHYVSCDNENCIAYFHTPANTFATMREAFAAWNTRASAWRPISEAPRDETEILTYRKMGLQAVAFWDDVFEAWIVSDGAHLEDVTHFQPLPKPPGETND